MSVTRTTTPATIEPGSSRETLRRSSSACTSAGCWQEARRWIVAGDQARRSRHVRAATPPIFGRTPTGRRSDAQTRSTPPTARPEDNRSAARGESRSRGALLRGCRCLRLGQHRPRRARKPDQRDRRGVDRRDNDATGNRSVRPGGGPRGACPSARACSPVATQRAPRAPSSACAPESSASTEWHSGPSKADGAFGASAAPTGFEGTSEPGTAVDRSRSARARRLRDDLAAPVAARPNTSGAAPLARVRRSASC